MKDIVFGEMLKQATAAVHADLENRYADFQRECARDFSAAIKEVYGSLHDWQRVKVQRTMSTLANKYPAASHDISRAKHKMRYIQ